MTRKSAKQELIEWLRSHKESYVKAAGRPGTSRGAWKRKLREDLLADANPVTKAAYIAAMLSSANAVWEDEDDNPYDPRQLTFAFTVGGYKIAKYLTFQSPLEEDGYRKVHAEHALLWHRQQATDIVRKKAIESMAKAARLEAEDAALLAICNNDLFTRLWDLRDGREPKAA